MSQSARTIARLLALATLVAVTLSACVRVPPAPTQVVGAQPTIWQIAPPGSASTPAGVFALRWLEITPQQYRFYYVLKYDLKYFVQPTSQGGQASATSGQPGALQVTASALLPASPTTPAIPLTASSQTLGQIGAYTVGVLHIGRFDHSGQLVNRAGQSITVTITPSLPGAASPNVSWRLTPLHQLIVAPDAHSLWATLAGFQDGLPEAQWYGPVQRQEVSYVKVVTPGQPVAERTYVFVRSDDPVQVQVISKAQYLALAGSENFTP